MKTETELLEGISKQLLIIIAILGFIAGILAVSGCSVQKRMIPSPHKYWNQYENKQP